MICHREKSHEKLLLPHVIPRIPHNTEQGMQIVGLWCGINIHLKDAK